MRQPHIDDVVRLNQDIPELALSRGQRGVVRSTWFAPSVAYEVEFVDKDGYTTALLTLPPERLRVTWIPPQHR